MSTQDERYVEVVHNFGAVAKRLGPMSERKAERVERGLLINMGPDYHTRIVAAIQSATGAER